MKNFKLLLFVMIVAFFTITSCTDDDTKINTNIESSASIKSTLTELRTHFNDDGSLNPNENPIGNILFDFCFDFVYPITLTYNTGAAIEVNDFTQLVTVLIGSTDTLFIDGISFPFDVEIFEQNEIIIQTINNEQEFLALVQSCNFDEEEDCICTEEYDPVCVEINDGANNDESFIMEFPNACYAACEGFTQEDFVDCEDDENPIDNDECFEYVFPISITVQGQTIEINSEDDLEIFIFGNNDGFNFVYPFEVIVFAADGSSQTLLINNEEDYLNLLNSCDDDDDDDCEEDCPEGGESVCVILDDGEVIEFQNYCYAECAGYTQNDFVNCNPTGSCEDDCPEGGESVCVTLDDGEVIEFQNYCYAECAGYTQNDIVNCNPTGSCEDDCPEGGESVCVTRDDGEVIEFQNYCYAECAGYTQNDIVDCNNTNNDCWSFVYPISVNTSGQTVTVNSDDEFNNIFNPNNSELVYPFDVVINGETLVINTPNDFFEIGELENMCN